MPPAPSALRDEPAPAATNDGFIAGAPAPKAKKAGVAQQHSRAAAAPAERDRFAEIEQLRGKKAFGAARDATRSLLRKRLDRPERVRALLLLVDIELEWGHLAEARATLDRLDRLAPERSSEWAARRQRVHEPPPAATTSSPR